MNVLSIQSHVAYGHVGNSAAVFPLQRLGVDVWPVHTVQFSNHTGYGGWRGEVFAAGSIREVVLGIEERGALAACDGVLSGYMGSLEIGEVILETVARVKRANPAARYCCDPVIGDVERGVFVGSGIPEFIRERGVAAADIVTPNQFELGSLTGVPIETLGDALRAIGLVHARGPATVLVTSLHTSETPGDFVDVLASDSTGCFRVRTPKLPIAVNGAGDAIAAVFFAHHLRGASASEAASRAVSSIFGVLDRTRRAGGREILLVEAQDEFVQPTQTFFAERIGQ